MLSAPTPKINEQQRAVRIPLHPLASTQHRHGDANRFYVDDPSHGSRPISRNPSHRAGLSMRSIHPEVQQYGQHEPSSFSRDVQTSNGRDFSINGGLDGSVDIPETSSPKSAKRPKQGILINEAAESEDAEQADDTEYSRACDHPEQENNCVSKTQYADKHYEEETNLGKPRLSRQNLSRPAHDLYHIEQQLDPIEKPRQTPRTVGYYNELPAKYAQSPHGGGEPRMHQRYQYADYVPAENRAEVVYMHEPTHQVRYVDERAGRPSNHREHLHQEYDQGYDPTQPSLDISPVTGFPDLPFYRLSRAKYAESSYAPEPIELQHGPYVDEHPPRSRYHEHPAVVRPTPQAGYHH